MRQVNPVLLNQLKADYEAMKQLGSPLLACQGMLVPKDPTFASVRLLIKSMPYPVVTNLDPAEVDVAGGLQFTVAGTPKTSYQGQITVTETEGGNGSTFAEFVVANGGSIDCDFFVGRLDNFSRAYELTDCKIRFDSPSMEASSRSQVLDISGSIDYMFFGAFASIGRNNTVQPGLNSVAGVEALVSRVQGVLSAAQRITGGVGAIAGGIGAVRGLL
jgi:hypothetical protein